MPKIDNSALRAILSSEYADALGSREFGTKLSQERERSMLYYLGDMNRDMPSITGRSEAVSTDVSDVIEGLMPSLMDVFFGGDMVVEFEAVGPEDEPGAKQETDYVNHVFMQKNPGFTVLYSFIKDSLLQKLGTVKVWWEEEEREEREAYKNLTDDAYAMIVSDPEVEIIEHTEREMTVYGV